MVLSKRKKEVRNGRINEMGCFSNDLKEKCFRSFSFFFNHSTESNKKMDIPKGINKYREVDCMKERQENTCKSVFRDGNSEPGREQFTKAWISLINQMERNKETLHR